MTSRMAIWLMVCPQILPLEEAACNKECVLFASLPDTFADDDIQIGSLTTPSLINYTYVVPTRSSKYIWTET